MKLTKGLYTDSTQQDQPPGSYRFAKNIIDNNILGSQENEDGFTDVGALAPYTVMGIIPVEKDFVVFSTNNTNSEIGIVVRTGVALAYTQVYNNDDLNFSTTSPITGEFRKNINGERVVAWRDSVNTPRILNIDNLTGVNNVEDLDVFQDVINPSISASTINDSGGSLKTGGIIPITKYKNIDGSETNWFVHDQVFYINDDSKSVSFNLNDGAEAETISNKSLSITFSGCDTRYDTLVVGYIQSTGNIVQAFEAFEVTNSSTLSTAITGSESTTDVTLDELLTPTTNYNTAETITQLGGRLYLGNLTAEPIPELQQAAININIDYTTSLVNATSNTSSHKDKLPPGFMPGEVYAFYLGVELDKGGWSFYHIPGRAVQSGEDAATTNEGMSYLNYQVANTANNGSASSNMGYWRNVNETYPNKDDYNATSLGGRDLRSTNVLHHRMPTLDHLITTHYSANAAVGITDLPVLGITASNVIIPSAIQSKIKRWKIFYAKKSQTDSLVLGSDLLQYGAYILGAGGDSVIRWSTGGNWYLEAQQAGTDTWKDMIIDGDTLRGHCHDLMINQSGISPDYARFNYRLSRKNINTQYTGFRSVGGRLSIAGDGYGQCASAVIDFTDTTHTTRASSGLIKRLDNFAYLPPNSRSGKFSTQYTEGVFVADINNETSLSASMTGIRLLTNSSGQTADPEQFRTGAGAVDPNVAEQTAYYQYFKILSDVHTSFTKQTCVPLVGYATPSTTSASFAGGDAFACYLSYLACGPINGNPDDTVGAPYTQGVRIWRGYVGYSKYNLNYRHQIQGEPGTYYHGKTDVRTLFNPAIGNTLINTDCLVSTNDSINEVEYDTSFNQVNEFTTGVIFSSDLVQATSLENTIIYSPVQSEESQEFSWRSFPSGNRYVIPKNKGAITNLQGINNKDLLIHTEYSLWKTRTDVKATAEGENIFYQSASLFGIPPEELVPTKSGYGGTQNQLACILTKAGYAFIDDLQGKVFLYDGTLQEISSNGNRRFFRDFMGISSNDDNPFTQKGYTIGFDERTNRLIVGKKDEDNSWTASYNTAAKHWISFHDYTPDYMFNTVDNVLYGVNSQDFYIHNIITNSLVKGKFYGDTIYSSYIDVVHNDDPGEDKIIQEVSWVSEVYPNTYTNNQPSTALDYDVTCTHLTLYSVDHCTGRIPLILNSDFDSLYSSNIRNLNRKWHFNDIRDITVEQGFLLGFYDNYSIDATKLNSSLDWFNKRLFKDKYVTCRYEYDNVVNKRFIFLESNVEYTLADR